MATIDRTRKQLEEPEGRAPIGWEGETLAGMFARSDELFARTGHYMGLERFDMKERDPLRFEKLFARVRGGMVSARETALNISASPIVRELGEICFALYTPEGDNVSLSTGIIVHVHTMSEAIKYMSATAGRRTRASSRATSSPITSRRSATSTTPTCRRSCRSSTRPAAVSWWPGPAA